MKSDNVAVADQATLLCVDDEDGVLQALKRLLSLEGYRVLTAPGGTEGLDILASQPVDLVISDMRMPGMDGASFLAAVRERWPAVMRILLTGHADIASTIAAINRGEIYRYLAKPWDNDELRIVVRQAIERQMLARERDRFAADVREQNEALRRLNAELETRVEARTAELRHEHNRVLIANEKLKTGFEMSIKVFANLIELGEGSYPGHARRVTDLALLLADRLGLSRGQRQDLQIAALLHDIGKIGMPDALKTKPTGELSAAELQRYKQHAATGSMVLMAVEELRPAARILRAHHERYDGLGYPDGLRADEIPLGARILAVANDFDALLTGLHEGEMLDEAEATERILEGRGRRYDPRIVDLLADVLQEGPAGPTLESDGCVFREMALRPEQLESGMTVSRDLWSGDGVLMLHRAHVLDDEMIALIKDFARTESGDVVIHVDADRIPP